MFKTNSRKMKDVMSKLRNILGDEFNDRVKSILETYPNLQVMKGVSKIERNVFLVKIIIHWAI